MADVLDEVINTDTDETPSNTDDVLSDDDQHKYAIMRNAYQKLDGLPLGFGIPVYSDDMSNSDVERYLGIDYKDTLRETRLHISEIEQDSVDELHIEDRIVYHAIKRARISSAIFFKFSTATDGKTVDKTSIPKILAQILSEYDNEYKAWRSGSSSGTWSRSATLNWIPNNSGGYSS